MRLYAFATDPNAQNNAIDTRANGGAGYGFAVTRALCDDRNIHHNW
jgi:hypothetical protein